MSESDTQATASDLQVLNEVLAAVAGRPRLAPLAAAASALAAELGAAEPEPAGPDRGVPPGTVPDVDVPQVTKPRIDQPLGDPPPGAPLGGTVPGVIDSELVDDLPVGGVGVMSAVRLRASSPTPGCRPGMGCERRWSIARVRLSGRRSWTGNREPVRTWTNSGTIGRKPAERSSTKFVDRWVAASVSGRR